MKTLSKVQEFIKGNVSEYTISEMSNILEIDTRKIIANFAVLKRYGHVDKDIKLIKAKIEKKISIAESKLDILINKAINKSNYKNTNSFVKNTIRLLILKSIKESGISGTILSLPSFECKLEEMICNEISNVTFIGVEKYKDTFNAMTKISKSKNLPIVPYYGLVSDKIYGSIRESYAHLILDYCGMLSSFNYEIEYALKEKLVPIKGTIHLTIAKNQRQKGGVHTRVKDLANTMVVNGNSDTRTESEIMIRSYFDKVCGFDYVINRIHYYKDVNSDGNNTMEMCYVQIERIA